MKITTTVKLSLDSAIHYVAGEPASGHRDQLLAALTAARRHAEESLQSPMHRSDGLHGADEMYLSLVAAAMEDAQRLKGQKSILIGPEKFEPNDLGWVACLLARLSSQRQPFPGGSPSPVRIPDRVRIALAGDWGTGNGAAMAVGHLMEAQKPDLGIHLGDVYYCGTAAEERRRFVDVWPVGTLGSFALNSNHEMYSGGEGYFTVALPDAKFSRQGGFSYFALHNADWVILGFDTAYFSSDFLYQKGKLNQSQIDFAAVQLHDPSVGLRPDGSRKRVMVLTHHNALDGKGIADAGLVNQVRIAVGGLPDAWYWGHDHVPGVFPPQSDDAGVVMHARCVGHGGVPYAPEGNKTRLWTETVLADDMDEPDRALNGFALLDLDGSSISEKFIGEEGTVRFASVY